MQRWAVLLLSFACALASCATRPVTEVVVLIDAEESLRPEITRVRILLEGTSPSDPPDVPPVEDRDVTPPRWPFTTVLAPRGGDAMRRYRVTATATVANPAGTILVRASSGFAPNRSWVLTLRFERSCLNVSCTSVDATCRRGACESGVVVEPGVDGGMSDERDTSANADGNDAVTVPPDAGVDAPACIPPLSESVDLLFMIDSSGSMREEQLKLVEELPRLVVAITTGDIDDDGTVDFPPASLHLGVITSDMGSGNQVGVRTCTAGLGDDGILRTTSTNPSPCLPTYPSGTFEFMGGSADALGISCIANVGTGGCGFEQQLEATLKALTPETAQTWTRAGYTPPRFLDAENNRTLPGHATGANAGFVRESSILAMVLLTDEDDCSLANYELLGDAARFDGTPPGLRCNTFSTDTSLIYELRRYTGGFLGLRRAPSRLVFSAITGIPPETEADADENDFAAVLAAPNMTPIVNKAGSDLEPSCLSTNGQAFPAVRIVQTAASLHDSGANVSLSSICRLTFVPAIDRVLAGIAAAASNCD